MSGSESTSKKRVPLENGPIEISIEKPTTLSEKRQMIAEFCRNLGVQMGAVKRVAKPGAEITPRMRQTLEHLLNGDSEKEVASRLGVSPNTVHSYVTHLYRYFRVSSRAELLAKCLGPKPRNDAGDSKALR